MGTLKGENHRSRGSGGVVVVVVVVVVVAERVMGKERSVRKKD